MQISSVFIACALAAVTIGLPAPLSDDASLDLKSSKIMARAPAEKKTNELKENKEQKCYIDSCNFPFGGNGGSSVTGAFTRTSFSQESYFSGNSLNWVGLGGGGLGFRGASAWRGNFVGASQDLGIFTNGFAGFNQAFQSNSLSWSSVQGAISSFGSDFSSLCSQLSSYNGFGGFSSGLQSFQSYFLQCIQTFQTFFRSILTRFGGGVFGQSNVFGSFQSGFQQLFRLASTVGIDCYSLLQSSQIDFGLFQQCGIPFQSMIGGGGGGGSFSSFSGSRVSASGSSSFRGVGSF